MRFGLLPDQKGPRSPGFNQGANSVQANPNKTKQIAWISLVLFVRIGTFQRVTSKKNKKIDSRLKLCAKRLNRALPISFSHLSQGLRQGASLGFCR
jgi:hypothetical protein